jgi:protein-tyrosine phosphatase
MVCLGNICRSPLAEGILKSKVSNSDFIIDSAGTGGWHIGELPDSRSIEVARINQIDITDQSCRKFVYQDFQDFDLIYVMDKSNMADVLSLAKNDEDRMKVSLILDELYPGKFKEVPDPYYGGGNGFEKVFVMLDAACDQIVNKLKDAK